MAIYFPFAEPYLRLLRFAQEFLLFSEFDNFLLYGYSNIRQTKLQAGKNR